MVGLKNKTRERFLPLNLRMFWLSESHAQFVSPEGGEEAYVATPGCSKISVRLHNRQNKKKKKKRYNSGANLRLEKKTCSRYNLQLFYLFILSSGGLVLIKLELTTLLHTTVGINVRTVWC